MSTRKFCAIPECQSTQPGPHPFFGFPQHPFLFNKWMVALDLIPSEWKFTRRQICIKHFRPSDVRPAGCRMIRLRNAVPSREPRFEHKLIVRKGANSSILPEVRNEVTVSTLSAKEMDTDSSVLRSIISGQSVYSPGVSSSSVSSSSVSNLNVSGSIVPSSSVSGPIVSSSNVSGPSVSSSNVSDSSVLRSIISGQSAYNPGVCYTSVSSSSVSSSSVSSSCVPNLSVSGTNVSASSVSRLSISASRVTRPSGFRPIIPSPSVSSPSVSSLSVSAPSVSSLSVSAPNVSSLSVSAPSVSTLSVSAPRISSLSVSSQRVSNPGVFGPIISGRGVSSPLLIGPLVFRPRVSGPAVSVSGVSDPSASGPRVPSLSVSGPGVSGRLVFGSLVFNQNVSGSNVSNLSIPNSSIPKPSIPGLHGSNPSDSGTSVSGPGVPSPGVSGPGTPGLGVSGPGIPGPDVPSQYVPCSCVSGQDVSSPGNSGMVPKTKRQKRVGVQKAAGVRKKKTTRKRATSILRRRLQTGKQASKRKRNIRQEESTSDVVELEPAAVNHLKGLPTLSEQFIHSHLARTGCKKQGIRWTSKEKAAALSYLKSSPNGYKDLSQHIWMPSKRTLQRTLFKFPFSTGIDSNIVRLLAGVSETMPELDRYCTIMFDEMIVTPTLFLHEEKIYGFTDLGVGQRSTEIADHLLLFMIRGIRSPWKMPIAAYLTKGSVEATLLKKLFTELVIILLSIGLTPLCSVSDCGPSNVAAVTSLFEDTQVQTLLDFGESLEESFYEIGGHKMYHIYDPPDLLKILRNHFLDKDIMTDDGLACWSHIKSAYEKDLTRGLRRFAPSLTDEHMDPSNKDKLKSPLAAQVFSLSVSRIVGLMAEVGFRPAEATSLFLLQMDDLFDSLNGSSNKHKEYKPLKGLLNKKSGHVDLWIRIEEQMASWRFFCNETKQRLSQPAVIKNWILTIRSMRCLWRDMQNLGFESLATGRVNLDSLGNFFECVRAQGVKNDTLYAHHALSNIKLLLVDPTSLNKCILSNCQDDSDRLLKSLEELIEVLDATASNSECDVSAIEMEWDSSDGCLTEVEYFHAIDLGNQILRRFFQKNKCEKCRKLVYIDPVEKKELDDNFIIAIHEAVLVTERVVEMCAAHDRILGLTHSCIEKYIRRDWFTCRLHCFVFWIIFKTIISRTTIRIWCMDMIKNLKPVSQPLPQKRKRWKATSLKRGVNYE